MTHNNSDSSNSASPLTRRQALKLIGSGALLVAVGSFSTGCAHISTQAAAQSANKLPEGAPVMDAFPLTDVRVLEGPFLEAQPVSYTHLRAHETGRNLVCRL